MVEPHSGHWRYPGAWLEVGSVQRSPREVIALQVFEDDLQGAVEEGLQGGLRWPGVPAVLVCRGVPHRQYGVPCRAV